jgi:starvation-inducible DNA-binding protein
MKTNIGIEDNARSQIAEMLSHFLADTYVLSIKSHSYHWNVSGPQFFALHGAFGTQYEELHAATDVIAERIRALGMPAPSGFFQLGKMTSLAHSEGAPNAHGMVQELLADHEAIIRKARQAVALTERGGDCVTEDLIVVRLATHEKMAWQLRSFLEG